MNIMQEYSVICVDDEKIVLDTLKEQLKFHLKGPYSIEMAESGEEALELLEELLEEGVHIPVFISDQIMPGLKGDDLLKEVHCRMPKTRTILLTGQASAAEVGNAVNNANLYRYIGKPWEEIDLALTVNEAIRSYLEGRELEQKVETFYKFVPVRFLELLNFKNNFECIDLGLCCNCNMTVMFSDIRSFSNLSEKITPRENFRFLNSYFAHMGPIIRKNSGFIDKYIGDGIMGLFESPEQAIRSAIEMLYHLRLYNEGRKRAGYIPISIGIGINSGDLMLGTIGENHRLETTVIGDVVNISSRLESQTKCYGTPLLVSEYTIRNLKNPDEFDIRFIDRTKVKGKDIPINIYEIFSCDPKDVLDKKHKYMPLFDDAVSHYHERNFEKSLRLFQNCFQINPGDTVTDYYIRRCESVIRMLGTGQSENSRHPSA